MRKKIIIITGSLIILLPIAIIFLSIVYNNEPIWNNLSYSLPQTEEACLSAGGDWRSMGMRGFDTGEKMCDMPTTDGGKVCTNWDQCQGTCLADYKECTSNNCAYGSKYNTGRNNKGHCSVRQLIFGCFAFIYKGQIREICVD